jgi:hypothetical protein
MLGTYLARSLPAARNVTKARVSSIIRARNLIKKGRMRAAIVRLYARAFIRESAYQAEKAEEA